MTVDLTARLAQNEPDPYVKQTLDFTLLEDFDLYISITKRKESIMLIRRD